MQKIQIYLRIDGTEATLVDSGNNAIGIQVPSISRGQKITFDMALFYGTSSTSMTSTEIAALADSFVMYGDSEYAQTTTALTSTSVTVETTGHLTVVFNSTNSTRMQTIMTNKEKVTLHCQLVGTATGSQQPVFIASFDIVVKQPVDVTGLA